jgi:hypothetical protein
MRVSAAEYGRLNGGYSSPPLGSAPEAIHDSAGGLMIIKMPMQSKYSNLCSPVLVIVLLLLPLAFSSPRSTAPLHLGLPHVFSGDEPHYLVIINSVIIDGDLDLANNYVAVHNGAAQAGHDFIGSTLDHHTVWFENGVRINWFRKYETNPARWDRDAEGHPVPRLRAGQAPPSVGHAEFSTHPPGVVLLLAPILFPFRASQYVEPLAICCSAGAIVIAMFMFRPLARKYNINEHSINLITAVTFLGTPIWLYGRTLFNEPYLLLFTVGAYSLSLRGKSSFLSGAFIGVGMLMKPPFALLIIPLFLMYVVRRDLKSAALLMLPALAALAVILWLDDFMFGSPWRASQDWLQGSVLAGMTGMLFSPRYGYLITAPAIIVAFAAWPGFVRAFPHDAAVLALGVTLYFLFFASYADWSGAFAYGSRYVIPILPLVFVALARLPDTFWQRRWTRLGIVSICVASISINAIAAMPYWKYWDSNPVYAMLLRAKSAVENF